MRCAACSMLRPVRGELLLVVGAQGLDPVGDPALVAFRRAELHAALVGQRLLGGIEHLHQVAGDAALGHLVEARGDGLRADRGNRRTAARWRSGRAGPAAAGSSAPRRRPRAPPASRRCARWPCGSPSAASGPISAMRSPARTSSSAMASVSTSARSRLEIARQVAAEDHGRRDVRPEPEGVRRLPFALAHVEVVGAGGAAPVDDGGGVARLELAELPEGLAGPGPAPAVDAVGHGVGDVQRVEDQLGQAIGKRRAPRLRARRRCSDRPQRPPSSGSLALLPPRPTPVLLPGD